MESLVDFVLNECIPAENEYKKELLAMSPFEKQPNVMEHLKTRAKQLGFFNLFFFPQYESLYKDLNLNNVGEKKFKRPNTLLEYAKFCEVLGMSPKIAPEACNCSAPDTGNMELLAKYGSDEQQKKYLVPLLEGKIRSAFAMTEPGVASSDAVNIATTIKKEGNEYVINGRKWWISNGNHPNLDFFLVFGVTDADNPKTHRRHSIVVVPKSASGVHIVRPMTVFGYNDAVEGHSEVSFKNVRVNAAEALVYKEGAGFEIIQGRLGPGRIHHCMRAIGMAERVMFKIVERAHRRETFGKKLAEYSDIQQTLAYHRVQLEQSRLLVYHAAHLIDSMGAKEARKEIAMIKVAVPQMLCKLIDFAIQVFGAAGVSQDECLAEFYAAARTLRIADGPDAVHLMQIAKAELQSKL